MMDLDTSRYKRCDMEHQDKQKIPVIRRSELKSDPPARPDELGADPSQVGYRGAGPSGGVEGLSSEADAAEESVEGLADTRLALQSAAGCLGASRTTGAYTHRIRKSGRRAPEKKRDKAA